MDDIPSVETKLRVLEVLKTYICAPPKHSALEQLNNFRSVLSKHDHPVTRMAAVRSVFKCLHQRPERLAPVLGVLLHCDWWIVKEAIFDGILQHKVISCYSSILSTDVVIEALWPFQSAGVNPFVQFEGITTDAVFTSLLQDMVVWEMAAPGCNRRRRRPRNVGQRRLLSNFSPWSFDQSIDNENKWRAALALETMKCCHSVKGLYHCLAKVFKRLSPFYEPWNMFLMGVLVIMGHVLSERLLKTLEKADDYRGFVSWYRQTKRMPLSLKNCARLRVRTSMRKDNIKFGISSLPIPQCLKDYILFSEVQIDVTPK